MELSVRGLLKARSISIQELANRLAPRRVTNTQHTVGNWQSQGKRTEASDCEWGVARAVSVASLLTLALLHIKVDDTAIGIARAVRVVIHCQDKARQAPQISLTVSTATQE